MDSYSEQSNVIHIGLGFDKNYIVHIYAMLTSVFRNNRSRNIILHAIATGITDQEKNALATYVKDNKSQIMFYEITTDLVKANIFIPGDSYFTVATFYRLFFSALLSPSLKKLLYIDPDTIVLGDLQELYNTEMGMAPVAAVPDTFFEGREELGITGKGNYFNAGVMVIDLQNWREQKVSEKVLAYVKANPEKVIYLDQDGLNAILKGNWVKLDKKYNFTSNDVILQVPAKQLIRDAVIVHYTSYRKPWNFLTPNKLRYLYHYYLRMSPKSNEKKYTDFKWDTKNIWTFIRMRIKEFYFDHKIHKIVPIRKWMNSSDLLY